MFKDRTDAGAKLAEAVAAAAPIDPVVLALPRGGVPLGAIVAQRLNAPLDLVLVRKIGMPGNRELAAGALVDGPEPTILFNQHLIDSVGLASSDFDSQIAKLQDELDQRRALYLSDHRTSPVRGRTAILVDDGVATGATVRAAIQALRCQDPAAIWVAVPVAPADTLEVLEREADTVICLEVPHPFIAVGAYYETFGQTTDDEVVRLMQASRG
ncbi:phosphoribosyltransferase [Phaeobacter marinintestinus]|uniref:phosphoribosyltransferase n=1 Tax=Falsiphaeobacter marinintestinus TaxID=1492905 RepID=UPI0011B4BFA6|nr:phosphoribosyltransferase family protein [Phaeobacter marinintestinus]